MSQAQRDAILAEQLSQVEARRVEAAAAAAREAEAAAYQHNVHKAVMRQVRCKATQSGECCGYLQFADAV